jgi:hypothetical protein
VHRNLNLSNQNPNPVLYVQPSAPSGHYIVPLTNRQWLALRSVRCDDHLDTSQGSVTALEERASDQQILQFVTSYQCAWIDKYLLTISSVTEDPTKIVHVPQSLGKNKHLLVQHLFPAHVTRMVDRNPTLPPEGRFVPQDEAGWESLDERIPFQETGEYLFPPEASAGLETPTRAAITYDVDSVIVYGDNIPLSGSLDIRAVPNPKSTFRITNHIATSIEGKRCRSVAYPTSVWALAPESRFK